MSARDGIVVCGATNRIEAVDAALLRPGRLERAIRIGRPDLAGVVNILRYQLGSSLKASNLDEVARLAEGSTPAELMEMVRAARRSARRANREMNLEDLKDRALPAENYSAPTLRLLSLHEAAHAVATIKLNVGKVVAIRLQSRGHVGGYTKVRDDTDELAGLDHIENRVVGILSARSAERLFLGYASTGSGGTATSDLGVATAILAGLHTSAGYGSTLLYRCNMDEAMELMRLDPRLQRDVEEHLRKLESRADAFVRGHKAEIYAVADALAAARHLSGGQIEEILERVAAGDLPCDSAVRRPADDDSKSSRKQRRV
jgi:ATP-dependent Zn protease